MSFSEWRECTLSDIADITMGQSPKGEFCNNDGIGVPLLNGPTEFGDHHPFPTQFTIDVKKWARQGDLLFCVRGSTTGRMNWAQQDYAIGRGIAAISPKDKRMARFIKAIIETKLPELLKMATGSTFPNVTRSMLTDMRILIPTGSEMIKINNLLESVEDKMENNNQINKKLEAMAQVIFKHWFVDFEFPNENGEPYKSSGGEMVESELGMIPKGWEVKTIKELPVIVTDYVANGSFKSLKENVTLYDEYNYALFMRNTDLKCNFKSGKKFVDKHSYEFLAKSKLYGGEIIISNVGDVGSVYLCPHFNVPMTLGNNVIMINTIQENCDFNIFLFRLFKSFLGRHMINSITGGSAQPKFNKTDFRNLKLVVPNENVLNIYNKISKTTEKMILDNNIENDKLSEIRDTLLPKLMSGEIRVTIESDKDI